MEHGIFNGVDGGDDGTCRVAHGGRSEQGDDEIVAVFPAPRGKGVAQRIFVVRDAAGTGDVNQSAQAEGGVDADAHEILAGTFGVQPQDVAAEADDVAQVVEKIADARAHRFRRNLAVTAGDRGKYIVVGFVVDVENKAVVRFIRVGAVAFRRRSGQGGEQRE